MESKPLVPQLSREIINAFLGDPETSPPARLSELRRAACLREAASAKAGAGRMTIEVRFVYCHAELAGAEHSRGVSASPRVPLSLMSLPT